MDWMVLDKFASPKFAVLLLILASLSACDRKRSQAVFVEDSQSQNKTKNNSLASDSPDRSPHHLGSEAAGNPSQQASDQQASDQQADQDKLTEPSVAAPPTAELIRKALRATVRLVGDGFTGSGVILTKDDDGFLYVLTVRHAVQEGVDEIEFFSASTWPKPSASFGGVEVISESETRDLAVLRVRVPDELEFGTVTLCRQSDVNSYYSSGCSAGKAPTVLPERIMGSQKIRVENRLLNAEMWVADSPQALGRSGGPLLNVNGSLLGIALGKSQANSGGQEEQGFYCHSTEISDYLIDSNLKPLVLWSKLGT